MHDYFNEQMEERPYLRNYMQKHRYELEMEEDTPVVNVIPASKHTVISTKKTQN